MPVKYSIRYLLFKQPAAVKKNILFKTVADFYNSDEVLKKVFIPRICFLLLNRGKVKPENLESFYRKYALPKRAFFPLFLKLKKEYYDNINKKNENIKKYIEAGIKKIPPFIVEYMNYFLKYEKILSRKVSTFSNSKLTKRIPLNRKENNNPVIWKKLIYPGTKKRIDLFLKYKTADWNDLFKKYLSELKKRYKNYDENYSKKLLSLFVFELPIKKHSEAEIKTKYRILSKKHHPDIGGDENLFKLINNAKNILLNN